jgi:hypothetical protein
MSDCGHSCCEIRDNRFHSHTHPPDACRRCRLALDDGVGERIESIAPSLDEVISSVMDRVVPGIAGLPQGDELDTLVHRVALGIYRVGLSDRELRGLDLNDWRTAIATRVGLALAFPHLALARDGAEAGNK